MSSHFAVPCPIQIILNGGAFIKQQSLSTRFWEIDAGRGVAIVLMVIYHVSYDLDYFDLIDIDPIAGWWLLFASVITTSFLFVAGISFAISHMRRKRRGNALSHQVRRGARIFGACCFPSSRCSSSPTCPSFLAYCIL